MTAPFISLSPGWIGEPDVLAHRDWAVTAVWLGGDSGRCLSLYTCLDEGVMASIANANKITALSDLLADLNSDKDWELDRLSDFARETWPELIPFLEEDE